MKENISIRTMSLSKSLSQHEIQLRLTEHPQLVHKIVRCAVHGESQEQSAMSTVRQDVCTPGWVCELFCEPELCLGKVLGARDTISSGVSLSRRQPQVAVLCPPLTL